MSARACLAATLLLAAGSLATAPQEVPRPAELLGVGLEQRLDLPVPLDLTFRDEAGRDVRLADLVSGKPIILNLVYYECPMLCTLVSKGLVSSLRALSFAAGKEFDVWTVSIDPRETAALAAAKKENVLGEYARPGAAGGWRFLTGDDEAIRRLTDAVGFRYRYDAATDTFAHASGLVVLTPGGRVSRYLYGVEYAPRDLRLALVEASRGKIGTLADQILLFCYHYDPASGRYSAATLRVMRAGGALTVLGLVAYVLLALRRER